MALYTKFDNIRPYYDEEVPSALQRIAESDALPVIASYIFPGIDIETVRAKLKQYTTIREFQGDVMYRFNEQVIQRTTTGFTYSGLEMLSPHESYLFVSNHRDIMLDSSLLQYALFKNGHQTSQITFGSNLMSSQLIIDMGKINKMFRVERGENMKDFYKSSLHLSEYIRHVLIQRNESVWIAQRNGRTKDGNDLTDQGIIKMFGMSKTNDKIAALAELKIVPISVSYEWESCDILKALEWYETSKTKYVKKPGEDLNSILTGISQPKGHVHIHFCPPVTKEDLLQFDSSTINEYNRMVAKLLDNRIQRNYYLFPNHFIAHDLLYGNTHYKSMYTSDQKRIFKEHILKLDRYEVDDNSVLKEFFLRIYANPVTNFERL